ncbi:hypothetical protein LX36DRAFT_706265 [Colletotrichum falcatum]|nr:hypothetical protein LX36DRAFT_706265 [Colletotrichum falcatum]
MGENPLLLLLLLIQASLVPQMQRDEMERAVVCGVLDGYSESSVEGSQQQPAPFLSRDDTHSNLETARLSTP